MSLTGQDKAYETKYGFKVDADGYFMKDFNQATRLPEDYKIHSSSIDSMVQGLTQNKPPIGLLSVSFQPPMKHVDIVQTIKSNYKVFSQVMGKELEDIEGENISREELKNLPKGFRYDRTTLEVQKVFQNRVDVDAEFSNRPQSEKSKIHNYISYTSVDDKKVLFRNAGKSTMGPWGGGWDIKEDRYTQKDGGLSKGGLFVAFMQKNQILEGKFSYVGKMNGYDRHIDKEAYTTHFQMAVESFMHPDKLDKMDLSALPEDLREYAEHLKLAYEMNPDIQKNVNADEDEEEYKDPLQMLFEQLEENLKENLKIAFENAMKARLKAKKEAQAKKNEELKEILEKSSKELEKYLELLKAMQDALNENKDEKDKMHIEQKDFKNAFYSLIGAQDIITKNTYDSEMNNFYAKLNYIV